MHYHTLRSQTCAAALLCAWMLLSLLGCSPLPQTPTLEAPPVESEEEPALPSLQFDGRRYAFSGDSDAISAEGAVITIQKGGRYRISGTLKEGSLTVAAPPDEVVHLLLDGVAITSSKASPLQITSAACVILESAADSVNRFSDTKSDSAAGSVIESACSLILRGEGSLIVSGQRACGLRATDDITVESGHITLAAPEDAIWVRDRFSLVGGRLTVTEATRGIVVGAGETDEGRLTLCGGTLVIRCTDTALTATRAITATGGTGSLRARRRYACAIGTTEGTIEMAENWLCKD